MVADVVGPVCETGDYLALGRNVPEPKTDDLLAVMTAGAYGAVQSGTYNTRALIPEVLVKGDQYAVVRAAHRGRAAYCDGYARTLAMIAAALLARFQSDRKRIQQVSNHCAQAVAKTVDAQIIQFWRRPKMKAEPDGLLSEATFAVQNSASAGISLHRCTTNMYLICTC